MQKFCVNLVPGPALPVRHLAENLDTFQVLAYTYTSVSETIRKLPLIKAQTAFKNQKINYGEKRFSIWQMELLHPGM